MRMFLLCLLVLSVSLATGCWKENKADNLTRSLNKTKIQRVANAFVLYANMNNFQSPKDKEELIQYITTAEGIDRNLDLMGIDRDTFADMFVSDVDGEEFEIRYSTRISAMGGGKPVAFEKTGQNGIRRVALSSGQIIEADDEAYERLMSGKVTKAELGATVDEFTQDF